MNKQEIIDKIIPFLTKIGIKSHFCAIDVPTFLPGIRIEQGTIQIDVDKLLYPGDLLHEAGHIAVTKAERRTTVSDSDFTDAGEEIVAILWSFAAAKEVGISLDILFHSDGYKGQSDWMIESFENQTYMGLPLLEWMGLTASGEKATQLNVAPFPNMIQWLRD